MLTLQQFNAKCEEIAKALGGTFTVRATDNNWVFWGDFKSALGLPFAVRADSDRRPDRPPVFSFYGDWPTNSKNEVYRPSNWETDTTYKPIRCNGNRPSTAIAADLNRRFLPGYAIARAQQIARRDESNYYHDTVAKTTAHLAHVSGGKQYAHRPTEITIHSERSDIYGNVRVAGTVSIELHNLTPAQAEAVLKLVKTL